MTPERAMIIVLEWLREGIDVDAEEIDRLVEDELGQDVEFEEQATAFALIADAFDEIEREMRQRLAALQPETKETA